MKYSASRPSRSPSGSMPTQTASPAATTHRDRPGRSSPAAPAGFRFPESTPAAALPGAARSRRAARRRRAASSRRPATRQQTGRAPPGRPVPPPSAASPGNRRRIVRSTSASVHSRRVPPGLNSPFEQPVLARQPHEHVLGGASHAVPSGEVGSRKRRVRPRIPQREIAERIRTGTSSDSGMP